MGKGAFVQVAFPGIFPDLTRWQAESDQRAVNNGQDTWKNDTAKVALNTTVKFLQWLPTAQTKILSGGGAQDVDAVVQVQNPRVHVGPLVTKVTLSRVEGNIHNMWVAIAIQSDGIAITSPQKNAFITSPVYWSALPDSSTALLTRSRLPVRYYSYGSGNIFGDD